MDACATTAALLSRSSSTSLRAARSSSRFARLSLDHVTFCERIVAVSATLRLISSRARFNCTATFLVSARHRSASTICRCSSCISSPDASAPRPCLTALRIAAARSPSRGGGSGAEAIASCCAATAASSSPSLARTRVSFSFHMASSSDLTAMPSTSLRSTVSHLPIRSAHLRAPSDNPASRASVSAASASSSPRSIAGNSAATPPTPTVAPAANAPVSFCSVAASTSRSSSLSSDAAGDRGSVGSEPVEESFSSSSSESNEAIDVAKGGARCAIAARYPSQ
mmetsp:Transcript_41706/g.94234  ORF Transcript_41706/g.94234 Transcript_41706/m.94234 type:complete len:282 (-) Transcript_41706:108-953(-)